MVVGAWFLTREVELSTTRACLVSITEGTSPSVSWCLPASKSDLKAAGIERIHYCECVDVGAAYCPVCAMRAHLEFLAKAFPDEIEDGKFKHDFPLFPDAWGRPCKKDAMASTFEAVARFLGLPTVSLDGSEVISGHSLRVTGAQGLSRLGLDLWAIQLLGRWGSDAVRIYVRAVPLEAAARQAARAARRRHDLEDVVVAATATGSSPVKAIQKLAADAAPRWAPTIAALVEPLEVEVESAEPLPPKPVWVRNESKHATSGFFHAVSLRLEGLQMWEYKARCGWRFGAIPTVAVGVQPPTVRHWEIVCSRCACAKQKALEAEALALTKER